MSLQQKLHDAKESGFGKSLKILKKRAKDILILASLGITFACTTIQSKDISGQNDKPAYIYSICISEKYTNEKLSQYGLTLLYKGDRISKISSDRFQTSL